MRWILSGRDCSHSGDHFKDFSLGTSWLCKLPRRVSALDRVAATILAALEHHVGPSHD